LRFLISGGDSALFELPIDAAITPDDLQAINRALVGYSALISVIAPRLRKFTGSSCHDVFGVRPVVRNGSILHFRLQQVLDANGAALATYTYDAGNRYLMSVEGGVTKYYAWAGGMIIAEYEAWGTNALIWKKSYVYLGGSLLATTIGADGTEMRFHHPDRLGTRLVGTPSITESVWALKGQPYEEMCPARRR
jgi:Domain of unknown function (DUF4147)